uniref:Uncharacterized protein n=1 Tax=Oryza sativa subsp. japonica TaxID=39947 RepID=Q9FWL2_ORYSJ|nr:hypothetical protein [Oryza sativa Japonica Group]
MDAHEVTRGAGLRPPHRFFPTRSPARRANSACHHARFACRHPPRSFFPARLPARRARRRTEASPPPICVTILHPPSQYRSNRGRKLQLSLSTSLSSPAAKKRDIANRRRALFISNSYSFHSHLTMTNNFGFDPIPFHLLQQRERRHVMVALERALCTAAVTSSPFPLIWTKPGQAVAPASSPQPPLHFPSRISKDGATSVEIVHRLLHLRSPSPLPNPPPPLIEPSPFTRRFLPPPSRYTSRRHQPSYPSHV